MPYYPSTQLVAMGAEGATFTFQGKKMDLGAYAGRMSL